MIRTYRTVQGDTWDIIAFREYGNEMLMDELMKANPKNIYTSIFPAGVELNIPKITRIRVDESKPPWMR